MPAVASYLITATIAAPALINMGFAPIAVHMFIFYFSCFSSITPPVALASYTAAGVAQTDPWETGYVAFKLAIVAFLCPFIFIYSPALLGQGSLSEMFLLIPTTFLGTYSFTCGVQGYLFGTLKHWFLRIPLLLGGILMIIPGIYTDLIGLSIVVLVSFINKAQKS